MSWYKTGTVNVTNGSTTVIGVGTAFVANTQVGEEFRLSGGSVGYEIANTVSDGQLTLARPYLGSTQNGASYDIVPVRGFLREAADALTSAIATMNGHINGALSGRFGPGSTAEPSLSGTNDTNTGIRFPGSDTLDAITNGIRRLRLTTTALEVSVPITGAAVQSSMMDATTGRLLTAGYAFGLGATNVVDKPIGNDLDNALRTGWYNIDGTTANGPLGGNAGLCRVETRASQRIVQTVHRIAGGGQPQTYTRQCYSPGTGEPLPWGDWYEIYNAGTLLGSVSQNGGVPTGAVIERGNNANGEYVRFADGTQICTQSIATSVAINTSSGSFVYRSASATGWTFPAAFIAAPTPVVTPSGAPYAACASVSPTDMSVFFGSPVSMSAATRTANLVAVGRWF